MEFLENKKIQFIGVLVIVAISIMSSFYKKDKLASYKENGYVVEGIITDHYTL